MMKDWKRFDCKIYIPAKCFHAGIWCATSVYNLWQNWNRNVYNCTLSFHVLSVHAGLILTSFSILSISDHIGHTSLFCPGVLFACDSLRFLSFLLQNYIYHKNISFLDEHVPYVSLHEPFVKTIDCISDSCASFFSWTELCWPKTPIWIMKFIFAKLSPHQKQLQKLCWSIKGSPSNDLCKRR